MPICANVNCPNFDHQASTMFPQQYCLGCVPAKDGYIVCDEHMPKKVFFDDRVPPHWAGDGKNEFNENKIPHSPESKVAYQAAGHPPQIDTDGILSTPGLPYHLVPLVVSQRRLKRYMLGEERKGDKAWNALASEEVQKGLLSKKALLIRLSHAIEHAQILQHKLIHNLSLDTDDDAAAISWAGDYAIAATDAMLHNQENSSCPTPLTSKTSSKNMPCQAELLLSLEAKVLDQGHSITNLVSLAKDSLKDQIRLDQLVKAMQRLEAEVQKIKFQISSQQPGNSTSTKVSSAASESSPSL